MLTWSIFTGLVTYAYDQRCLLVQKFCLAHKQHMWLAFSIIHFIGSVRDGMQTNNVVKQEEIKSFPEWFKIIKSVFLNIYNCMWKSAFLKSSHI